MSNNTVMFPGSADVFIHYHDILGTPKFMLLLDLIRGIKYPGLYNLGFFSNFTMPEMVEWYIHREKDNYLDIDMINIHQFTSEENGRILHQMLLEMKTYSSFIPVNLYEAFLLHPIIDNIHVYTREHEPMVSKEITSFGSNLHVQYEYGKFEDIISTAKDQCTLITNSTSELRSFLHSDYQHRYVSLIFPNNYDSIKQISDVYSTYAGRISVIDIRNRISIWKESII